MAEVRSGSFTTSGYSDAYSPDHYVFSWSLSSQSIVDNTTTINWSVVAAGGATSGYYNTVRERYVTVYGVTKSASDAQVTYNGTTPFSGTTVIKHDANGKGSFSASCGGAFEYSGAYNSTGSGSWDLPTIARATTPVLAATTITMGSAVNITLTPANGTFKHKLRYDFGSVSGSADGFSVGAEYTAQGNTTVTFTPPTSLGSQIPNALSGTGKIVCYTYTSSGAHIGTTSVNITLNIPSYTPSITNVTLTGVPETLLNGAYVKGKSKASINFNYATQYGAGIKSIKTVIDGVEYTGIPVTTNVLSAGSKTAKITFIDTRDKSVTVESSAIQVYDYAIPNITEFSLARQSDGTTVIATIKGSISAINNKNTKTIKVTLNGVTNTVTSSAYTINATTTFTNVSTDQTFTGKAVFTDSYTSVERIATLPTIAVTMDFYKDGNGIAMGKVAEQGNLLDIAWDERIRKNLTVDGNINDVNIGTDTYIYGGARDNMTDENWVENEPSFLGSYYQNNKWYNTLSIRHRNGVSDGDKYGLQLRNILTQEDNLSWRQHVNGSWKDWRTFLDDKIVADYVVDQGVSGEWNYTKWNNGKSEAWRKVELGDVPLTTQMIAGVYSSTSYNGRGVTLPSGLFAAIPLAFANVYSNGYTHCQVASANTTQVVYRLWSPYSATVTGVIVSLYVVGRWK